MSTGNSFKEWLVNHFSFLGKYKRFFVATRDTLAQPRKTYSQHREDLVFWDLLKDYSLDGSVYVDVGANHPTSISNTYLLYRNGLHGIVIEPNKELVSLFRRFRKRDLPLALGCSNSAAVLKFHVSKTPVISSFSTDRDVNTARSVYVPVLPLDTILEHLDFEFISLLSIDVEGLNYEVLQGAANTLRKTLVLCIEFEDEADRQRMDSLLGAQFMLKETIGCNLLYVNKHFLPAKKHVVNG